jgi:hypothetical protein
VVHLDLPDPFIPFLNPVSAALAGEGQHHLPGPAGLCDDSERYDKIPDCIFT